MNEFTKLENLHLLISLIIFYKKVWSNRPNSLHYYFWYDPRKDQRGPTYCTNHVYGVGFWHFPLKIWVY